MEGALLFYLYEEVGGESLARSVCSALVYNNASGITELT